MTSNLLASAVGRRKEAIAEVKFMRGTGQFIINDKPAQSYLNNQSSSLLAIKAPFEILTQSTGENQPAIFNFSEIDTIVNVQGGGLVGQSEAIRLGVARALCSLGKLETETPLEIRKSLKVKGYLTQDSRAKERRKYGLKKARKASQYHKR
jgi:small subunit ribosomal protein S9|uniref:Small ribosomal subunit protein uS9c n=1 Tax=Spermatozopsis similis TaxID=3192 RepID=A0A4P1LUA7_SPESI|nr:ribosomal protein S9 [Spermatozopsis similis]AYQ95176.1 ribosomal protein S9 [Spermatozopsis similis]